MQVVTLPTPYYPLTNDYLGCFDTGLSPTLTTESFKIMQLFVEIKKILVFNSDFESRNLRGKFQMVMS